MIATHSTPSRFTSANHLHARFRRYGAQALAYRNKCIGMLPRIFKEKVYAQKGFDSIFEYAAKFAGLSREQVNRALNLHASFCDKPALRATLESGEVSISKLARIASVATPENQEFLADQAKLISKSALETLAKDIKYTESLNEQIAATEPMFTAKISNSNGLFEPTTDDNLVPGHKVSPLIRQPEASPNPSSKSSAMSSLELSPEVQEKLLSLQNKGLDINAILLELLEKREREIEEEKEQIAQTTQKTQKPLSRHIPAKTRRILQKEHGAKCSIPHCQKPSQHIHHTQRFALLAEQNNPSHATIHDPNYLAPLCREHHRIAHSIDVTFQEVRRRNGM